MSAPRTMRRWPLFLIAAPAAVAVWSGWVGLGTLCGFGVVHPLPGIIDGFWLNTAITLPVGVEAYGAYALGAWLAPAGVPASVRTFARRSAVGALVLGMAGQVIYHLLAAAHAHRAPWPVVVLVSCLPVVTLGFGAALTHLLRTGGPEAGESTHVRTYVLDPAAEPDTGPAPDLARTGARVPLPHPDPVPPRAEPGPAEARTEPPLAVVDRDALVAHLVAEILAAAEAGDEWRPDYAALMTRTGYRRSWCEKAVRDARRAALGKIRDDLTEASAPDPEARTDAEPRTEVAA